MNRPRRDQAVLITSAPESGDDELDRRQRRYLIMMGIRALCVIAAALTYQVSVWLAVFFILGGALLPWCAVIIANDGPPKKRRAPVRPGSGTAERALPGDSDTTIEG